VGRIVSESIWLACPGFANVLERREAVESFEPLGEVVGVEEGSEMGPRLPVVVEVVSPDSNLLLVLTPDWLTPSAAAARKKIQMLCDSQSLNEGSKGEREPYETRRSKPLCRGIGLPLL
jgi:hypothetical protein